MMNRLLIFWTLLLISLLSMHARVSAQATAPSTQSTSTQHDYLKSLHAFNLRTTVGAYKEVGKRDPKWDDDAIKFLEATALYFTGAGTIPIYEIPGSLEADQLLELASAARKKGCTDPFVKYC